MPHLLGFHPARSLVVVGAGSLAGQGRRAEGGSSPDQPSRAAPRGRPPGSAQRVELAFRYDLPDPPDPAAAAEIAGHAAAVLEQRGLRTVIGIGYGPGRLVTPVADALGAVVRERGLRLHELLRVEDGRYWSYICVNPDCCPPEGVRFDVQASAAAAAMTVAGLVAYPDRAALAGTLAPVTGAAARAMERATIRARARAAKLVSLGARGGLRSGHQAAGRGRAARRAGRYRQLPGRPADHRGRSGGLALGGPGPPAGPGRRLGPDGPRVPGRAPAAVVRRGPPGAAGLPGRACPLLAFTAWQSGEGALANIAIDHALAADPGYSLAHLLRDILDAGVPPSEARPPMTPEQVADGYAVGEAAPRPPGRRVPKRRDLGTSGGKPGPTAR